MRLTQKHYALISAVFCLAGAMALYHGGSFFNHSSQSYGGANMVSDLGVSTNYMETSQHLVNALFAAFIFSLASAIWFDRKESRQTKPQNILTLLAMTLLACVFFFPSNIFDSIPHNLAFFSAVLALGILNLTHGSPYRKAMGIVVIAYGAFLFASPAPSADLYWRMIHATAQRTILGLSILALYLTKPEIKKARA